MENILDEKFNSLKELIFDGKLERIESLEYKLDKILFLLEKLDKKIDKIENMVSIKDVNIQQNKNKKNKFEEFGLVQETLF